jgi:putative hydrolase of HD superfamily
MLALPFLARRLDLAKYIKICLIHNMTELLVGDITLTDRILKTEKNRREALIMDYIIQRLLRHCLVPNVSEEIRVI